jgi:hypothetical protein
VQVDTFWQIIGDARAAAADPSDGDDVAAHVEERLAQLPADAIAGFAAVLAARRREAYRWDVWGAAYLINGGCSDDGFDYFRAWLVTQGRDVWDAALADPDSLASFGRFEGDVFSEDMVAVPAAAHARVTGDRDRYRDDVPVRGDGGDPGEPQGEEFDFDDDEEMRSRLPRLAELHLGETSEPPPPVPRSRWPFRRR